MAQIYASKTNEIQKYETEHENEVRHLAGECMVLLENDGVLPFSDKIKKIALYGTGARHTVKGGTGSGDVNVRKTVSIARGLEEAGFEIVTEDWLDRYDRDLEEAQKTYLKKLKDMSDETGEPSVILGFKHPFQEPEAANCRRDRYQRGRCGHLCACKKFRRGKRPAGRKRRLLSE